MNRLCIVLLICCPVTAFTQQADSLRQRNGWQEQYEQNLSEELEQQVQDAEEASDIDVGEYLQALDELRAHPLNIHAVDDGRMSSLLRLSEYQLYQLRRYIDLHGIIQTPQELAGIDGFSVALVQSLLPYLQFGRPDEKEKLAWKQPGNGKSEVLLRYGRASTARDASDDEGSADALLLKYTYRRADVFRAGLVMEKDAGESFFRTSNPQGFDYLSAYVSYKGKHRLKQCLLGDYQLQFGQGLAMGMGFLVSDVSPEGAKRDAYGLKPHTSANEGQFLRGGAFTLSPGKNWNVTLFLSSRKVDATVENGSCSSLSASGYHRTLSEIQKKHALQQQLAGAYVDYHGNTLHWGSGVCFLHYGLPVEPETKPYSMFRFRGQQLWNVSTDFSWNYRRSVFYGEAAVDPDGNVACTGGVLHPANNRLQFSAQFHFYPSGQQAVPDALKGSGELANEQGLQCRMRLLAGKTGVWDVSWEEIFFPWLKYQLDAPSQKTVCMLRYTAAPEGMGKWLCSYRWKRSQQQETRDNLHVPADVQKHSARVAWTWTSAAAWQFRLQWDGVACLSDGNMEKGVMVQQACSYRLEKLQLHVSFAFFHTDSYRVAVYASEKDVLYVMRSPSFSGKGYRANLVLAWKLSVSHSLQAKFGLTQSFGPQPSGRPEVKVQWIWKG